MAVKKLSVVSDISNQGLSGQEALDHVAQLAAVQALAPQAPAPVSPPPPQVQSLLDKYPENLKENFNTNEVKNGVLHKINLKPGYTPFRAKVRRLLPASPKEVLAKKAWFQLLDMGIIEKVDKSTSNTLSSPVHFVPKSDNTLRPTGDFRALNLRTELDVFPLPHLRDFTHKIRGCKYFSKVDLMKSFHQTVIDPSDRFKTTVTTPWGMFQLKRLAMGLQNAAQSFQRLLQDVIGDMEHAFGYLDDILLFSESKEDHLALIEDLWNAWNQPVLQ